MKRNSKMNLNELKDLAVNAAVKAGDFLNENKSEKKDYQRYAQIRNAGLKADDQGKINRKEAKKWLKSRSGRRKLNELYIDNKLDYLIGYIDFEEMCS